jgi:hypothetical protein
MAASAKVRGLNREDTLPKVFGIIRVLCYNFDLSQVLDGEY